MKSIKYITFSLIAAALIISLAPAQSMSKDNFSYEITVTNLTRGMIFTPILAATHSSEVSYFTLGEQASTELAQLAEGGLTEPLDEVLQTLPEVGSTATSEGPVAPGETVTFNLDAEKGFWYISLAGMLVPTNDAFVAVDSTLVPFGRRIRTIYAYAYDAGSEMNDENCENIPGPCEGEGYNPNDEDAEGYVHIHAGIHGIADLEPADYDWRNPVAKVTIDMIRNSSNK